MTERPILFSGAMVRAILAGKKTQTRRAVSAAAWRAAGCADHAQYVYRRADGRWQYSDNDGDYDFRAPTCPYGVAGDRLWVRENGWERPERTSQTMRDGADTWAPYYYDADGETGEDLKAWGFKRRPSIHMPRRFCRLLLEVTGVRVERLQAIGEDDAIAEGIRRIGEEYKDFPNDGPNKYAVDIDGYSYNQPTAVQCYRGLWGVINGGRSWDENPWVWVVEFKSTTSHGGI